MKMKDFFSLLGALLVNLLLFIGLLYLPPVGTRSLEGVYVLVWLAFGLLINLGFLRKALGGRLKLRRRQKAKLPARRRQPMA
jgi:hypothetical protein